jgi:uncharacterized membrane protein/nitrite reductase/ring-hydroxylating ferredoxin subunit
MKSKASIKSHPLHPILVAFPIAFFIGALVADIIAWRNGSEDVLRVGEWLGIAGVTMALVAAIPGIIDYIFTVPPESSAKQRATKHGLLNITVVILFVVAHLTKGDGILTAVLLEGVAVILLMVSGWLGGTLVYRNQIGVDPRYAEAGKWNEQRFKNTGNAIEVASVEELKDNQMKLVVVDGKRIVVGRSESAYYAFDDRCTHKGGSLAGGALICKTVQCPWHGSQFAISDGAVKAGPAKTKIKTYPLEQRNNKLYLNPGFSNEKE